MMTSKPSLRGSPLALAVVALALVTTATHAEEDTRLSGLFESFYEIGLSGDAIAVQDVRLKRPEGTFVLEEGVFIPAEPIEGVVTGGVFLGKGSLRFLPSQKMDQEILRSRMAQWMNRQAQDYRSEFDQMVVRFTDDTLSQMGEAPAPEGYDRAKAESIWKEHNRGLDNMENLGPLSFIAFNLELDFIEKLLNSNDDQHFFVAEIHTPERWMTYSYNNHYIQEVFFGYRKPLGNREDVYPFALTNVKGDFDANGNYSVDPEDDDKLTLDTDHYRLVVTIPNTSAFTMDAAVDFTPRVPLRVVRFNLINNISTTTAAKWDEKGGGRVSITRVADGEGNPLTYLHKKHELLVEYPAPLEPGEPAVLSVTADEDTITQLTPESYQLLNTYPWFPQHGFAGGRNTHEWTVKIKKPLVAVVSGRLEREWEEDGLSCTGWIMDEEVQFPSLIFGKFTAGQDSYKSELTGTDITLRVYAIPHGTIGNVTYAGVKRMQPLMNEAKQIIKLFEHLFGPYPYDYLNIAQMAPNMGFGQAPPGLVQLTGEAFMSQSILESDFIHEFFSHEIAHQWWAHVVWGTSFRDAWLSESFAEYAAGLYVLQYSGEPRFQAKMKTWRQNARQAEGTAPIAGLSTLGGDMAGKYYQEQIYNKGPYVVHMLRMQLGHEKWTNAMRSFFEKNRHVNVATESLIAEMEQEAGYKLDFFFDQWWKGMDLPEFEFTYDIQPTEDGKFLFTGKITQNGQPFKVLMPVYFHFGGKQTQVEKRPILQQGDVYKAVLPKMPKKVTLDEQNTLLADINQKK